MVILLGNRTVSRSRLDKRDLLTVAFATGNVIPNPLIKRIVPWGQAPLTT